MKRTLVMLMAVLAVTCWVSVAGADLAAVTINVPNTALTPFPGPYAFVQIDRANTGLTANITFTSATAANISPPPAQAIYLMGDGGAVDLNVNGTYTLGAVTTTKPAANFNTPTVTNAPGNVDGFGVFNLSLNFSDGFTSSASAVSFTLTNTSGTPWATAAQVVTPNAAVNGFEAAIHAFPSDFPADATINTFADQTGFAANGAPFTGVPLPPSVLLLGSGLLGMGLMGMRRKIF